MSLDHVNANNAMTTFQVTYSSVRSVGSWLVTDAGETGCEEAMDRIGAYWLLRKNGTEPTE